MTTSVEPTRWRGRARSIIDILLLGLGWIGGAALAVDIGGKARVVASWGDGNDGYGAPDQFLALMATFEFILVVPMIAWVGIAFLIRRSKAAPMGAFVLGVVLCNLL